MTSGNHPVVDSPDPAERVDPLTPCGQANYSFTPPMRSLTDLQGVSHLERGEAQAVSRLL